MKTTIESVLSNPILISWCIVLAVVIAGIVLIVIMAVASKNYKKSIDKAAENIGLTDDEIVLTNLKEYLVYRNSSSFEVAKSFELIVAEMAIEVSITTITTKQRKIGNEYKSNVNSEHQFELTTCKV